MSSFLSTDRAREEMAGAQDDLSSGLLRSAKLNASGKKSGAVVDAGLDDDFAPSAHRNGAAASSGQGGFGALAGFGASVSSSKPKSKVSHGTVILCIILIMGVALLFAMRKYGMGPVMRLAEMNLEYEPTGNPELELAQFDGVMKALKETSVPAQIPAMWIERDPFVLAGLGPDEVEAVDDTPSVDLNAQQRARLRMRIDQAVNNLRVQSVMGGRVPLARIDDETLRVGDTVDELFEIIAIAGRTVTFRASDGRVFEAQIGEKPSQLGE